MAIFTLKPLRLAACLSVLGLAMGYSLSASAEQNQSIYGDAYSSVSKVAGNQAQIVYFRNNDAGKKAAHVYIDGELQSALMPGGYTVFCTPAGEHALESYVGDEPLYAGKRNPQSYAKLVGGQTYVLEASVGSSTPVVHTGKDAEQSLQGLRRQIHVISRASAVVPCNTETKLSLRSDVLFAFGKSSLTAEGHGLIAKAVQDIKQNNSQISSIEVVGHADPIGNARSNQTLSQQRAETVRQVLLEQGIEAQLVHASGRGSSEPVVSCATGSRKARIACNAPNRRVELIVQGSQGN